MEESRASVEIVRLAVDCLGEAVDKAFKNCENAINGEKDSKFPKFFPNGIELISGTIDIVGAVKLEIKIAGPKPKETDFRDVENV